MDLKGPGAPGLGPHPSHATNEVPSELPWAEGRARTENLLQWEGGAGSKGGMAGSSEGLWFWEGAAVPRPR